MIKRLVNQQGKKIFSNKKLTVKMLLICICYVNNSFSQNIENKIYNTFPTSIITKLYKNVCSKIIIREEAQLYLATEYKKQDSLIANLIFSRKLDDTQINRFSDSTDYVIEENLKRVLTIQELRDFDSLIVNKREYPHPVFNEKIEPNAEMNSLFGIAIKMKKILNLQPAQIDSIKSAAIILKTKMLFSKENPDFGYFDKAAFESFTMSKYITDDQFNILLAEKNKEQCIKQAKYIWFDLKKKGLAEKFNKEESVKNITIYYMLRVDINERFAHDTERKNSLLSVIKMPEPLKVLQDSKKIENTKLKQYAW